MRRLYFGTGGLLWAGLVMAIVAGAFLGSILLTPRGWQWWMDAKAVHGRETNGIVMYSYGGSNFSVDDPLSTRNGARTVYLLPGSPGEAVLHNRVNADLDWLLTVGPLVLGVGFVMAGSLSNRRRARKNQLRAEDPRTQSFGSGLDPETVRRIIAERRTRG